MTSLKYSSIHLDCALKSDKVVGDRLFPVSRALFYIRTRKTQVVHSATVAFLFRLHSASCHRVTWALLE